MTISFYPRPRKTPRDPESIKAWGAFAAAALGGLAAVLTALGALGSGCVSVQTSSPDVAREVGELREEMREERLARDRELRSMRTDDEQIRDLAKFAKDKAVANEISIESHHPRLTKAR